MDSVGFGNIVVDNMVGNAEVQQQTQQRIPYWLDALETMPGITQTMGTLAYRTSSSMLFGHRGAMTRWGRAVEGKGAIRQAIYNNNFLNPANWTRTRTLSHVGGPGGSAWRPFQAAEFGNYIARSLQGVGEPTKLTGWLGNRGWALEKWGGDPAPYTSGMYSRISAAARLGNMSEKKFARYMNKTGGGKLLPL